MQRVRGRPLGAYIRQLQEWESLDPGAFQLLRAERLAKTLEYARNRVPLYRSGNWANVLRNGDARQLRSWPLLDRQTIQTHGADMLAQPTPRGYYFRSTSGSTGTPLRVAMDPSAAAWAWAADYHGLLWHGIRVGDLALTLRPRTAGPIGEWIRNNHLVPATDLSPGRLTAAVRFLERARPAYVWGYVSAVVELARHARLLGGGAAPLVPFAKVFGEMLYPFQRELIEEGLGARVIETYGCNETGTVAYECPAGSIHVFAEHVEVEIVNNGEPAAPGEMGEILLTCTTNRTMPLIRYRVGDRGRLLPDPCSCGRPHPVLDGIEGRSGDVLLTASGVQVHGTAALGGLLKKVHARAPADAIRQVRFEQHDPRTWTVLVQPGPGFGDLVAAAIIDGVRSVFGQECRVTVQPVQEIPREPSGKIRFYRTVDESQAGPLTL
ncbi:MAG: phenylacetate--CoA ligase family protein [Gemmatimonadales bacterium]|nr:phenylacetate--CoA ligase family protein [Gemmatimonadales bacterium]